MARGTIEAGLLAGPRGRRLCWTAVEELRSGNSPSPFWNALFRCQPEELLEVFQPVLAAVDLGPLSEPDGEALLLNLVAESVDSARYWQEPDELDVALADPRLALALRPVAELIAAAPATAWWSDPVDPEIQVYVDWREDGAPPPEFRDASVVSRVWREQVTSPGRRYRGQWVGGPWWSTPGWSITRDDAKNYGEPLPMIAATTRPRPQLGAIGLLLQEDTFGTPAALCWPVRAKAQVRSYEIDTPDHWIELLDRYGIDVTGQRRAQWSQATGLDTYWLLPDWSALAEDYDVVHLTMNGYLATSGRALGVNPENATFVAGWNPDTSYWLTDVLEICGSPLPWEATEHNSARHWRRADDS